MSCVFISQNPQPKVKKFNVSTFDSVGMNTDRCEAAKDKIQYKYADSEGYIEIEKQSISAEVSNKCYVDSTLSSAPKVSAVQNCY